MACGQLVINLFKPDGTLLGVGLTEYSSIDYQRSQNEVGTFELILPPYWLDLGLDADYVLEIYREIYPGQFILDGDTCWFIRRIEVEYDENNNLKVTIGGHDTMGLLARRIVAWAAPDDTPEGFNGPSYKTEPAEDAIKEIFIENFGSGALGVDAPISVTDPEEIPGGVSYDANNRLMSRVLQEGIDAETSTTIITQDIAWQNALSAMQSIASDSAQRGEPIWFDIVYTPSDQGAKFGSFAFHVWTGQRGLQRNSVVVSPDYGNLISAKLVKDYAEECTWVHVGGAGDGSSRIIAGIVDTEASARSQFYPIECFIDSANSETSTAEALIGEGSAKLHQNRALIQLTGTILQTEGSLFGVDFSYGDRIKASAFGIDMEATISKFQYHVDHGGCSLEIPLEASRA